MGKLKRTVKTPKVFDKDFCFASPNPKGFLFLWEHFGTFFVFGQLLFNTWEPERKHLLSSYGDVH